LTITALIILILIISVYMFWPGCKCIECYHYINEWPIAIRWKYNNISTVKKLLGHIMMLSRPNVCFSSIRKNILIHY